jgi:hypothetical protein
MAFHRMNFIRSVLGFVLLVAFTTSCRADSVIYMRIDRTILEKRAQVAPSTPQERLRTLRAQFRNGGCPDLLEQPVPGEELPNLICTLPGNEGGIIVVSARLDYRSHADDEAVEWATLELLPLLAESLNASPHRRTLVFAALTGHDHNFAGSTFYLNSFTEARRKTLCGMIFLDHLGRASPGYAYPFGHSPSRMAEVGKGFGFQPDPRSLDVLVRSVSSAAHTLKLPQPLEINDIAATDTRVFAKSGVLTINFHSLGYTTIPAFGAIEVRVARNDLVPAIYSETYNLLCVYVLLVDKALYLTQSPSLQTTDNPTPAR